MSKKANGEGSIYQRKEDKKWVASVTLDSGKRKVFYGKTRKEAHEKLQKALQEQKQGKLVATQSQTVEQYLAYWLMIHKKNVRPRTHERYEEIVPLHLVPTLGKVRLDKLTPHHLEMLYTNKLESGLSGTTVAAIHNFLHTALDGAVRQETLSRNVCDLVSSPRKNHEEIKPLNPEQIYKLLEAAKGHINEALFILALATGMRRGELLGLKWQDIDFDNNVLHVRRTLSRVPTKMVEEVGASYVETETKTKLSRRSIVLIHFAIEALKQHKSKQLVIKQQAGDLWENHDYVFCSPTGTYLGPGHNALVQLKKLLEKAGLPDIRFHDLRHSAATALLSMDIHPKIVQEILGHSEIGMTMNIYSHVLPTMQKDAMGKLQNVLKPRDDEDGMTGVGVPSKKPKM